MSQPTKCMASLTSLNSINYISHVAFISFAVFYTYFFTGLLLSPGKLSSRGRSAFANTSVHNEDKYKSVNTSISNSTLSLSTDSQFLIQCDLAQEYLGHNLFITALNLCQITVSTAHYKTRAQRPGGKQKPMRAGELGSASKASCSQAWQVPQLVQYGECTQWMDRQTLVSYHVLLQYAGF